MKGKTAWNKGVPMTEEGKENLRIINTGKKHSKESIEKRVLKMRGRDAPWKYKPILQYTVAGEFVVEHISIRGASKIVGTGEGNISNALTNFDKKTAGGFRWKYKEFLNQKV